MKFLALQIKAVFIIISIHGYDLYLFIILYLFPSETKVPACLPTSFKCDNNQCISNHYRCDGDDDCGDKSDEKNCSKRKFLTIFGDIALTKAMVGKYLKELYLQLSFK